MRCSTRHQAQHHAIRLIWPKRVDSILEARAELALPLATKRETILEFLRFHEHDRILDISTHPETHVLCTNSDQLCSSARRTAQACAPFGFSRSNFAFLMAEKSHITRDYNSVSSFERLEPRKWKTHLALLAGVLSSLLPSNSRSEILIDLFN